MICWRARTSGACRPSGSHRAVLKIREARLAVSNLDSRLPGHAARYTFAGLAPVLLTGTQTGTRGDHRNTRQHRASPEHSRSAPGFRRLRLQRPTRHVITDFLTAGRYAKSACDHGSLAWHKQIG